MNIITTVTAESMGEIQPVLSGEEIISIQNLLVKIPVPDHVVRYSWKVVRALRPGASRIHQSGQSRQDSCRA